MPTRAQVALKESRPDANLGPANLFAVLTIIAFLTVLPIALVMDGPNAENRWSKAVSTGRTPAALVHIVFVSGVSFYLYNEVSFFVLDAVDPVTHAVGNTMKVRSAAGPARACGPRAASRAAPSARRAPTLGLRERPLADDAWRLHPPRRRGSIVRSA